MNRKHSSISSRENSLKRSRQGFNLVEMAIALVVVAIGIVSIIGLFPAQLDAVKKTKDRANMGQLALSIDNALRGLGAAGIDYLGAPMNGLLPLPSPNGAGGAWVDPANGNPAVIRLNNTKQKIHFADPNVSGLTTQSMWYNVQITNLPQGPTAPAGVIGRRVIIQLWPGDQSNAPTTPPVEQFITEIYQY